MDSKLKISSFNCRSLNANINIVKKILEESDILLLQETLIDENNCKILDEVDQNFMTAFVPSYRQSNCFVGRSSGGLAFFLEKIY